MASGGGLGSKGGGLNRGLNQVRHYGQVQQTARGSAGGKGGARWSEKEERQAFGGETEKEWSEGRKRAIKPVQFWPSGLVVGRGSPREEDGSCPGCGAPRGYHDRYCAYCGRA